LVALVFVVMVSAIQRMRLNVDEQGLSELRIYVTVFIGWMAVMLLWFAATALRGQWERFAAGALATGLLAAVLLNAINPDAMIARDNLERIQRGQNIDHGVIRRLSADGVVAACQPVAGLDRATQDAAIQPAVKRWRTRPVTDWRSWNWSRSQAMEAAATCAPDLGR
jgi:two-component system, OmpR family, sensor histidine kinase BaeS